MILTCAGWPTHFHQLYTHLEDFWLKMFVAPFFFYFVWRPFGLLTDKLVYIQLLFNVCITKAIFVSSQSEEWNLFSTLLPNCLLVAKSSPESMCETFPPRKWAHTMQAFKLSLPHPWTFNSKEKSWRRMVHTVLAWSMYAMLLPGWGHMHCVLIQFFMSVLSPTSPFVLEVQSSTSVWSYAHIQSSHVFLLG